jgi:sugar-specific transcriptional regulator TrmB
MSELSIELIESLKTMGLAEYEAKVYSTLVLSERAAVKRMYEYLNMPKPSVYQSLKGLMDKGLVMMVSSKPAIYKAVQPRIALRSLIRIHEDAKKIALNELESIEKSNIQIEDPYIIWTLFGENNVEHSMEELMSKAKKSMKLILPEEYLNYLSFASNKDLKIELIMFGKDSSLENHYKLKNLTVHDGYEIDFTEFGDLYKYLNKLPLPPEQYSKYIFIHIDDNEFMYVPPYPEDTKPGITSKNPYLVRVMSIIFDAVFEHTSEVPLE